jgi:hypothetical protein
MNVNFSKNNLNSNFCYVFFVKSVMSRLNDEKQKDSVCITNFHIDLSQDNNSKLKNGIKKQRLS